MKACWPAPERNKGPILEVLRRVLPDSGTLLELASGSGQHVAYFAEQLPRWTFLPSDVDSENLASIEAYRAEQRGDNIQPPCCIDVRSKDWGVPALDAVFNANMIHIAPWSCCVGLLHGAARYLRPGGLFALYGPFRIGGVHTAPSNARFDESLRRQNEHWGVRDLEAVVERATSLGLEFMERVQMPAENQTVLFRAR